MTNNVNAAGTVWNAPNYVGELLTIGQNKTPFLNAIGGIQGGIKIVGSWEFPLSQHDEQEAPSQPEISETDSLTAPTPTTFVRSQDTNVCQIFQESVAVSYAKQSNINTISGLSITGEVQPVQNEKDYQISRKLKQIAIDFNYSALNGVYNKATHAGDANKMRGVSTAITSSSVAALGNQLTGSLVENLLKEMADNGADLMNPFILCNSYQLKKLNAIYGFPVQSVNVGGTNITKIITPFAELGVIYDPSVKADELLILDMSLIVPVALPVPGKGVLFYEDLSKTGASEKGQLYGQLGISYGHESKHGKITGLATA